VTVFVLGKNVERTVFADNEGKLRDRITSDHGVEGEYMVRRVLRKDIEAYCNVYYPQISIMGSAGFYACF
jgi:hypothetical protein